MISLVRVDDRLIHGQVTVGWVPYLQASQIVVVNDRLSADPVLSAIVKAGGTVDTETSVMSVTEAAAAFEAGGFESGRIIMLFETLGDVHRARSEGLKFSALNLGGIRGSGEGLRVGDAVVLSEDDQRFLRDLRRQGVTVEVRLMPGDQPNLLAGEGERS
jgi:mannose/fructose/N-acetylgalactosamine-specific phosphotransferase system component IIB